MLEYDFGSWLPHDDAYMKGYAQGNSRNDVYVYLNGGGKSTSRNGGGYNQTIYRVAEIGGIDFASSAGGTATSKVGTLKMVIK